MNNDNGRMIMNFANESQTKEVYSIFRQYPDIFPHTRFDYIERKIKSTNCIYDSGVVITFTKYKRTVKLGDCKAQKDDVIIHQIANSKLGNGSASTVLKKFIDAMDTNIWLTVRANNNRACMFYGKMGFNEVGYISWKNGTLDGKVYKYER